MSDLCCLYDGLKQVTGALTAIDIFKTRARKGELVVQPAGGKKSKKKSGAASLPVEIWCSIQDELRAIARSSFHRHGKKQQCDLGKDGLMNMMETGGDRSQAHQSWCALCWPGYDSGDNEFSYIPQNELREYGGKEPSRSYKPKKQACYDYPQELEAAAKGKDCHCKACNPYNIMHEPTDECATGAAFAFERTILEPHGLRLACVLCIDKKGYQELCGVTLANFPDLSTGQSSKAAADSAKSASTSKKNGKNSKSLGQDKNSKTKPSKTTGKRKRGADESAQSDAISADKMEELLQPFRKLLADYPSLRVDEDSLAGSDDDDESIDQWARSDDSKSNWDSPFHLCFHHTPVKRGQLGPEGMVAKYDGWMREGWRSELEGEFDSEGSDYEGW